MKSEMAFGRHKPTTLRQVREGLGLTQSEFCKVLGISSGSYSAVENGVNSASDKRQKHIARKLGMQPEELFEDGFALRMPYKKKEDE